MNDLFLDTIQANTTVIDAKAPYTYGHSQRVSEFAVILAKEMELPQEVVHQIRVGGLLHDVGKIGIPGDILTKPSRLTGEEYGKMKEHSSIGVNSMRQVRMLKKMKFPPWQNFMSAWMVMDTLMD